MPDQRGSKAYYAKWDGLVDSDEEDAPTAERSALEATKLRVAQAKAAGVEPDPLDDFNMTTAETSREEVRAKIARLPPDVRASVMGRIGMSEASSAASPAAEVNDFTRVHLDCKLCGKTLKHGRTEKLSCGHTVHFDCWEEQVEEQENVRCPVCSTWQFGWREAPAPDRDPAREAKLEELAAKRGAWRQRMLAKGT